MTGPLAVLFEDAHCLAVVKPAGLLTQGTGSGEATLEDAVRRHLSPAGPRSAYLGTVHRLDRPVSGVVVWAKTTKAARRLADEFARRAVVKEYWAIVEGDFPATAPGRDEVWDDWLADSADTEGVVRTVASSVPGARRATTRVRVARPADSGAGWPTGTTWLRLWPETGRTHQLRAQSGLRGRPIVGDAAYGATRPFARGIALHARALTVRHPILRSPMTWVAPLPGSWDPWGIAPADPGP